MSGPYCKDCKHFRKMVRRERGECLDRSKLIFSKHGERENAEPEVGPYDTCSNWTPTELAKGPTDGLKAELVGLRHLLSITPDDPMATPMLKSKIAELERELASNPQKSTPAI